jgi:hypothetical protein
MNIDQAIADLRAEFAALEKVIAVLEDLSQGYPGRARRKRRPFSAETRKKMALAQKKRWAAARKSQFQLQSNTDRSRSPAAPATQPHLTGFKPGL